MYGIVTHPPPQQMDLPVCRYHTNTPTHIFNKKPHSKSKIPSSAYGNDQKTDSAVQKLTTKI
jgi:hypothetical protein